MQNPFRSEAEAFRFLIRTIAYFAVIAVAITNTATPSQVLIMAATAITAK